jgi:murein DD-endopeptidase MepM/ murein hydrolase activator NlpD
MNHKFLIISVSFLVLISCNSNDIKIDKSCLEQNSDRYAEPIDSEYNLPFGRGESYELSQGNCTDFSHTVESGKAFSFDFMMDIGTPIHAARAGQVAFIEDGFFDDNGVDEDFNVIIIEHEDKTFAYYIHLTNAGVTVELGEFVNQGDVIGYSGNTGMSTGPHLHFHVVKTNDECFKENVIGDCPTIPITFMNASPNDKILNQGIVYTAL